MKFVFFISVFILIWQSSICFSQTGQAFKLNSNNLVKFVSEDKSFEIEFPGQPQKNPSFARDLFNEKDLTFYYSSPRLNENYAIGYSDFPSPVISELQRQAIYELSAGYGTKPSRLIKQGNAGVEYSIDDKEKNITFTRCLFVVGQRFFQLSVATPLLSKLSLKNRKIYRGKIDKFFNSFIIKEIPKAKFPALPDLPKDFDNKLKNQVYSNGFLGFSLRLPASINVFSLYGKTPISVDEKQALATASKPLLWLWSNNIWLLKGKLNPTGSEKEETRYLIRISRPDFNGTSMSEFVEGEQNFSKVSGGNSITNPVQKVVINGLEFLMFETQDKETLKFERLYYINRKRHFVNFLFEYFKESELQQFEQSLKTLSFPD